MQEHLRLPWSPRLAADICVEHNQECLMYCRDDKRAICTLCTFGAHKGHDAALLQEEGDKCRERLRGAVVQLEAATQQVQVAGTSLSTLFEEVTGRSPLDTSKIGQVKHSGGTSYAAVLTINRRFDELRDLLESRRRELIDQVYAISNDKAAVLTKQMDAISMYVARNYSVCIKARQSIDNERNTVLLQSEGELLLPITRQLDLRADQPISPETCSDISISFSNLQEDATQSIERVIACVGQVVSKDVDPGRSVLRDEDQLLRPVTAGREIALSLQLFNRSGEKVTTGGDAVSCIVSAGDSEETAQEMRAVDNGNGSYSVTCRFPPGEFTVRLAVRGVDIAHSPYRITATTKSRLRDGVIGSEGSGAGQLYNPDGVCCSDGLVYAVDCSNHRVQVFDTDGSFVRSIGSHGNRPGEMHHPSGICCVNQQLFVSDYNNHCVHIFKCDGTYVRCISRKGVGPSDLRNPYGICCVDDLLYVSDHGNHRVQVFRMDGSYVRSIYMSSKDGGGEELFHPSGICCDDGLLFVSDYRKHRVMVFRCDGTYVRSIGTKGSSDTGHLYHPTGICCHGGRLFVSDYSNHRVQVFSCDGAYLRSIRGEGRGGAASEKTLCNPYGICIDDGLLYVSDSGNHCVQVFAIPEE
jgi:sugar lactone lactonase YvrE